MGKETANKEYIIRVPLSVGSKGNNKYTKIVAVQTHVTTTESTNVK